jgi:hypothetical protein
MSSTLASIVDADESGGLGPSAPPTRSLRSRVGTTDDERACGADALAFGSRVGTMEPDNRAFGAGATFGRSMPLALLAAMTRWFAALRESRCAGAGGAAGIDRGFVACLGAAWTRPRCAVGAFADAASLRVQPVRRGLRPHRGATRRRP